MWGSVAVVLTLLTLLAAPGSRASEPTFLRGEAESIADPEALDAAALRLGDRLRAFSASTSPEQFEGASEALGSLISRARELRSEAASFARLIGVGEALLLHLDEARLALEAQTGEDEAALEKLYRSPSWQRLDYAEVTVGYWLGWARLARGQGLPAGAERRAAMKAAERAFSRASLEFGLPRIATLSLLGLGVVRRELGESELARRALELFEKRFDRAGRPELLAVALYELSAIALEQGDIEGSRGIVARIPPGSLPRERMLALQKLELRAWLERAEAGQSGAEQAARLLQRLNDEGGAEARFAAAVVLENRHLLAGLETGPAGDLIRAETAFAEGRFAEAGEGYEKALAHADALADANLEAARFRYAVALSKSGASQERPLRELEGLLTEGGGGSVRVPAARLYYSLASAQAAEQPGSEAEAGALRAAELLLQIDPEAPEAGHARYRVAASRSGTEGAEAAVPLLEAVPESSESYPAARLELARLQGSELQRIADAGHPSSARTRAKARALASEIDRLGALVGQGRLPADAARDAKLAVLRAKAAAWGGEPSSVVLALIRRAEGRPELDRLDRRSLLRLRLATLRSEARFEEIAGLLDSAPQEELRRDWEIWYEALQGMEGDDASGPSPALLLRMHARLAPPAPEPHRDALRLFQARLLLRAGRAKEAAARARELIERDASWGDAWVAYARALDATEDAPGALAAWSEVAAGVEEGSALWFEAELGAAAALRRAGDARGACRRIGEIEAGLADWKGKEPPRRLGAEARRCAGASGARPLDESPKP